MAFVALIGVALLILGGIEGVRVVRLLHESQRLVAANEAFEVHPSRPSMRVLVVGDSLAAGVGAADPADSLAGRIAHMLPGAEVVNEGVSGARINEVKDALRNAPEGSYDFIFITAGANNILHLASLDEAQTQMDALLKEAKTRGRYVVLLTCGNMGLAPIFPPGVSAFYSHRASEALQRFAMVADQNDVAFIDLYYEEDNDPFAKDEERYYAADKFHPSGAGYGIWYEQIVEVLQRDE